MLVIPTVVPALPPEGVMPETVGAEGVGVGSEVKGVEGDGAALIP